MWKAGTDVKELVNGYLNSVRLAEETDNSEIAKWPSWEMNNNDQVTKGSKVKLEYKKFSIV